ncbi:MAG: pyocin knob domain-containing protein [Carnobacterium sp.]|uniref:pyocin knob domain-containing protein n=1 Tax=Carnobacterium sp. TaxID=48221 RepID=UPI002FC8F8F9
MSYEKQTWNKYDELKTEEENIENGAVVTDNRMNHMETGIGDNDANLASHLADKNNPHKVTAAQVGLDKVDNVKQASKVEFDSHTSDISNPHKVTATQIGLDKVDNIQQAAKTDFDSHVNNKANPHAVTASQVGAYSKTESDSKLTDLSNKVIANKGNLASGTDLDNVIDIGTYRIGGLTGGTDIINVPSERSGTTIYAYLTVSGTTTSVVQELIVYDSKTVSQIYSRSRSGSTPTFSPWSKTVMADDYGKVSIGTLDSNTLTVQGTKIYPNTKDGVWTVERLFDNEYRLTTVMSVSEAVTNAWGALFISPEVTHPTLPSGYNKNSWSANLSNSTNLMWCSISGASVFRLIAGASTSAATRTVIVTVYASK